MTGAGLTVSLGLAGGLASVVWGGTSVPIGLIAAFASAAIGLGITWLARVAVARNEESEARGSVGQGGKPEVDKSD